MAKANVSKAQQQKAAKAKTDDQLVKEIADIFSGLPDNRKSHFVAVTKKWANLPSEDRTTESFYRFALELAPDFGLEAEVIDHLKSLQQTEKAAGSREKGVANGSITTN